MAPPLVKDDTPQHPDSSVCFLQPVTLPPGRDNRDNTLQSYPDLDEIFGASRISIIKPVVPIGFAIVKSLVLGDIHLKNLTIVNLRIRELGGTPS